MSLAQDARLIVRNDSLIIDSADGQHELSIYSLEGFQLLSDLWLRSGWHHRYSYSFTWMGRPIIQMPEDMIRIQELIFVLKPDVIIETGIAHGGSLIFYASLCKLLDRGRVIGVDIEIRPHNRQAIEAHSLFPLVTLIEGDSVATEVVEQVKARVRPGETVLVVLDSNHTKAHVLAELKAYASLVTPGSYIIAADGIMEQLVGAPRTQPDWGRNNPKHAAQEFVQADSDFVIEEPTFLFNESSWSERVTYWPGGFVKRIR